MGDKAKIAFFSLDRFAGLKKAKSLSGASNVPFSFKNLTSARTPMQSSEKNWNANAVFYQGPGLKFFSNSYFSLYFKRPNFNLNYAPDAKPAFLSGSESSFYGFITSASPDPYRGMHPLGRPDGNSSKWFIRAAHASRSIYQ